MQTLMLKQQYFESSTSELQLDRMAKQFSAAYLNLNQFEYALTPRSMHKPLPHLTKFRKTIHKEPQPQNFDASYD
jgi:hypothetical protein